MFCKQTILKTTGAAMPMKMCLMLDELHPGLPGFDARYRFSCYLNNEKIESYTCTLSCAHPEVKFYGFEAVVPYSIRESHKSIDIQATYMLDPSVRCLYKLEFVRLEPYIFDDFDGDRLDPSIWRLGWPWGVSANIKNDSMMTGDIVRVEDSQLVLPAIKKFKRATDPLTGKKHTASYLSSCVNTLNRLHLQYGCVMVNVKFHSLGGVIFSAWLAQVDDGYFLIHPLDPEKSKSGELGFVEYSPCWGEKYAVSTHYYRDGKYSRAVCSWCDAKGIAHGYNTFGVVRIKNGIFYYYNGELVSAYRGIASTSTSELCLLMTTSFGSKDSSHYGGIFTDDMLPLETRIDWVKIYKAAR